MIIIIEGCDKCGKSTIVQDLISAFPSKTIVFKLSQKPKDNSIEERMKVKIAYSELFEQAKRLSKNYLVIFDRAYPSEIVYSIKRGYDAFEDEDLWKFDQELGTKNLTESMILFIYCTAPIAIVKKRFKKEKESFAKIEEIIPLQNRYEKFLKKTKLPYIIVDSTKDRASNLSTIRKVFNFFDNEYLRSNN